VRLLLLVLAPAIFPVPTTALPVHRADDLVTQTQRRLKLKSTSSPVVAQQPTFESRASEAKRLYQEGIQLDRSQRFNEALEAFKQALEIFIEINHRGNIGATLNNIGLIYSKLGQPEEAIVSYKEALENTPSNDLEGTGNTLYNIAVAYDKIHQYQQAFSYYQQALAVRGQLQDKVGIRTTLGNLGSVANNLGQYQQALTFYQQALTLYQEVSDHKNERATLQDMAVVQSNLAQNQQAIESLEKALENCRDDKDCRDGKEVGATLNKIGEFHNNLGQYQEALKSLGEARNSSQKVGDNLTVGAIHKNIGAVYTNLGQPEKALEFLQQSLDFLRKAGEPKEVLLAINDLAIAYRRLNNLEKALELLREALDISSQAGDKARFGAILNNIGTVYDENNQAQKALKFYQEALTVSQQIGNRPAVSTILNNIGVIYNNENQPEKALDFYQQALAIQREISDRAGEKQTLYNMGLSYEKQNNVAQAIDYYQQAVEVAESIQGEIKIEELKATFASQQVNVYSRLINLLWDKGDFEAAFNYIERSRARAFLDQLAGGKIDLRTEGNSQLLAREQALKAEIIALHQQRIALRNPPKNEWDNNAIADVENQVDAREREYEDLLIQLKLQNPKTADLISVDVAPLSDIQRLLDTDTTLVEYFVTDKRTLAFIITHNSLKSVSLDASREDLAKKLKQFRDFSSRDNPYPAELQQLHQWLIVPLKPYLNTPKIGIVPHNILHYLPFAALSDGKRYLSDDYTLFNLPSANSLRFLPKEHTSGANTVLALGNPAIDEHLPPLKHAKQEVEAIARLFNTRAIVGKAATKSVLWSRARGAGTLHLAVHSEYNPNNPLFSTLYLAEDAQNDGRLEVHEIYGLDLSTGTNLVVLSACKTQIGELSEGDEVVGLNRAFLYAGTPTVIASLWHVDDRATRLLMERFYNHLIQGMSKAQALRQAQIELRAEYSHPFYWSAFVLTGNAGK
jgi:CHAT domain-containing protein/Tfp pilus assembly protein PilF